MEYQTPADRVEVEQARLRRALRTVVPAFGLALIGFVLNLLAARIQSRPLQLTGFAIAVCGVLIGVVAVVRTWWAVLRGVLSAK